MILEISIKVTKITFWKIYFETLHANERKWEKIKEKMLVQFQEIKKTATIIYHAKLLRMILKNRYAYLRFSTTRVLAPILTNAESILPVWHLSKGFCRVLN